VTYLRVFVCVQLYDMSPDPKRKEFLDDLFSFMQKRGEPFSRLRINTVVSGRFILTEREHFRVPVILMFMMIR